MAGTEKRGLTPLISPHPAGVGLDEARMGTNKHAELTLRLRMRATECGGRRHPIGPAGGWYRPDLRVDAGARLLPAWIIGGPDAIAPGEEGVVQARLWFDDVVDCSALIPGATGVVLEGPHVVGEFEVLAAAPPQEIGE
jgi:hypothetical protein